MRRYYKDCFYGLCEYSAGTKLMWRNELNSEYAETDGCLVVKNIFDGRTVFDYPVPGPDGDIENALASIENWCLEKGIPPVISIVPEPEAALLLTRYPFARTLNIRTWRDYIYNAEDLRSFAGRRFGSQRNHVNKFRSLCPSVSFRTLGKDDGALVDAFWNEYDKMFSKDSPKAKRELTYAKGMMKLIGKPWFCAGGMELEGRLLSISLGERCGETLIIHVEKALYAYEGVYPATVQAFAEKFSDGARWINREDDAGDKGLRMSKMQYQPVKLAAKYCFEPQNELCRMSAIPTLGTERLTLSAITEKDAEAYYHLCMDKERNRWWGYDDLAGVDGEIEKDSFLKIAERDFENRFAINFAVRLDGAMIGEAVLYRFDYKGAAELGCRIAPEHAGHGYGAEAFAAVADWALYRLHMTKIVAKCFKENEASRRMLASNMRPDGEDEKYFYFYKTV